MMVEVKLFAGASQAMDADAIQLELPTSATVGELRQRLAEAHPQLAPWLAQSLIAMNEDYASDDQTIGENVEIALIPPVSGG